jgi:hypothetical protein
MGHRLTAWFLGAASFLPACSHVDTGGPTTVRVEGRVISAKSQAGIEGADVNIGGLLSSDFVTTTTGSDGSFAASVESFGCEGDIIFVTHTGYFQPTPYPNICPGSSHTVQLRPGALTSHITPPDPTVGLGGTVNFQVRVTFYDGTIEDQAEAAWFLAPTGTVDDSECGSIPDDGPVRATTYTAPSVVPPAACGPAPGQVGIVAAPVGADPGGSFEGSDTVVVMVTP